MEHQTPELIQPRLLRQNPKTVLIQTLPAQTIPPIPLRRMQIPPIRLPRLWTKTVPLPTLPMEKAARMGKWAVPATAGQKPEVAEWAQSKRTIPN